MLKKVRGLFKRIHEQLRSALRLDGLQFRITVSSTVIALLAIAFVSMALYFRYQENLIDRTLLNNSQLVEQVGVNLDTYLLEMTDLSKYLEEQIRVSISAEDLERTFAVISGMREDVVTMAVFNQSGSLLAFSSER